MMMLLRVLLCALMLPLCAAGKSANSCQVYFSPDDSVAQKLVALIEQEKESLCVAAYAFSHGKIAQALIDAKDRGVKVEVIVDPYTLSFPTQMKKMHKAGIDIWVWDPPVKGNKRPPLMHDKFCLFGEKAVWTGSFNFTYTADVANQENALLIQDEKIAKVFKKQFQKIKEQGCREYQVKEEKKEE